MTRVISSEKLTLFSFFTILIFTGSIFLSLPIAWAGTGSLDYIDALFTAVSAVCVTGLITVDTAAFTTFGKIIILILIQTGGLGIISFTTIYLAIPKRKISLRSAGIIKKSYIDSVEHQTEGIIKTIIGTTFFIELTGAIFLFYGFKTIANSERIFVSIFHSVSAFCNAGFSLFSDNLMGYGGNAMVTFPIMILIVVGGLGFVVIQDLGRKAVIAKRLTFHTKIVLYMTLSLIFLGALAYYLFEKNGVLSGMALWQQVEVSFFQSITTRTAGFNTVPIEKLSLPAKFVTLPLMFIGGGSGSIAGGVKVTTIFIILAAVFKDPDKKGEFKVGNRKIAKATLSRAQLFVMKAVLLLFLSTFALTISEQYVAHEQLPFLTILFESISAFGTVGLSMGLTAKLTIVGKCVIIFTMFAGRVGLISMAIPVFRKLEKDVDFPVGEVLIG